jgi:renalase
MASPQLYGRPVDLGAAYFTVQDDDFRGVVADWQRRGLVRKWTDTLEVFGADGHTSTRGPMRFATRDGLRSLARDLHGEVTLADEVHTLPDGYDVIVLAMPDPQASRLAGDLTDWVDYDPVIAVAAGFSARTWALSHAAFVNGDPDLALIADDGARRGDNAAVLVLHTTPERAAAHLDDPDAAIAPTLAAARKLLDIDDDPVWTHSHRWTYAKPVDTHGAAPFWWDGGIALCGDSWCPSGSPRVEAAWLSGHRLGTAIGQVLGSGA